MLITELQDKILLTCTSTKRVCTCYYMNNYVNDSYKDQLSLINRATRCITANVLQTNDIDAQCSKLATKLSRQRFASKVTNCQQPHLHLTYPTCTWRLRWGHPV